MPFRPDAMTPAQLAAVSYPARYPGHTHELYAAALRRWRPGGWCETSRLDPLAGIRQAHIELYLPHLHEPGLRDSSVKAMRHGDRGFLRFAHIDGPITTDPAVYARPPRVHADETRTQGLDRPELIRFLPVAQTITVHHGAPAYLLGINTLRASGDRRGADRGPPRDPPRPPCPCTWSATAASPPPWQRPSPVPRALQARRGHRAAGPLTLRPQSGKPIDRRNIYRMVRRIAKTAGIPKHTSPHSRRARRRPTPRRADPRPTRRPTHHRALRPSPRATSTATASTSSPPTSPASDPITRGPGPTGRRGASTSP
jgi:hypothetical protein